MTNQHRRVSERAYFIWEAEGRRHGIDLAHWFQAEAEMRAGVRAGRGNVMPIDLWAGVERKISNARFFLEEMWRSLEHDPRAEARAIAAGLTVHMPTRWEESFYARLDAFLVMSRSVPEVITCCFGKDRSVQMRNWFLALPASEKARRQAFSTQFTKDFGIFRALDLSNARDITVHRYGYPDVVITVTGKWGVYTGTPISRLPTAEAEPPTVRDTDTLKWAATLQLDPIRVTPKDFTIGGKPLAEECRLYLAAAENLVVTRRAIATAVHGTDPITPPP